MLPTLEDVRAAASRLAGRIVRTPLEEFPACDGAPRLLLKLENRQHTRSFKPRGALNAALAAHERVEVTGLVTFSSGNHGQAVALAAREIGVPALVVAPEDVRAAKLEAMTRLGAEVVRHGSTSAQRMERAHGLAAARGWLLIPPYDHPDVVAGQGTIGLEIAEDAPHFDIVCVPIGGGGLASGIATALAALRPEAVVVGVEPDDAADARASLAEGHVVANAEPSRSACDGLRNTRIGDLNWRILQGRLSLVVTVSDAEVLAAAAELEGAGLGPVEPSGAAATAAVLAGRVGLAGRTVVAVVSGGNA